MNANSFIIDWRPDEGYVERRPDITRREPKRDRPWEELRPSQPAEAGKSPMTMEEFLRYVVVGSPYQPEDVVAVGVGTHHMVQGYNLAAAYLTPRGMEEATTSGTIQEPYTRLQEALRSRTMQELDYGNLARVIKMTTGPENSRELIDWGGPDGKRRVLAVYSIDTTAQVFTHGLKEIGQRKS